MIRADSANIAIYYAFSVLCTLFITSFLYIVATKSRPVMCSYRNTLLNVMIWYLMGSCAYGLLLQPVYAREGCVHLYGFGSVLGRPGVYGSIFGATISILNVETSIVLCFYFRYLTLARPKLPRLMNSVVLGICAHSMTTVIALVVSSIVNFYADIDSVAGHHIFCVHPNHQFVILALGLTVAIFTTVNVVVAMTFMVLTVRVLQRQKHLMSTPTYRMQKTLTISLFVLSVPPVVLDAVPVVLTAVAIALNSNHLYLILSIASHMPCIEAMTACVFTIWFVKPYREAVVFMFCNKKTAKVKIVRSNVSSTNLTP